MSRCRFHLDLISIRRSCWKERDKNNIVDSSSSFVISKILRNKGLVLNVSSFLSVLLKN